MAVALGGYGRWGTVARFGVLRLALGSCQAKVLRRQTCHLYGHVWGMKEINDMGVAQDQSWTGPTYVGRLAWPFASAAGFY